MTYTTAAARHYTYEPSCGNCWPNRWSRLERARRSNHNVAVIVGNHHSEDAIGCRQLSVPVAVEPLARSQIGPTKCMRLAYRLCRYTSKPGVMATSRRHAAAADLLQKWDARLNGEGVAPGRGFGYIRWQGVGCRHTPYSTSSLFFIQPVNNMYTNM